MIKQRDLLIRMGVIIDYDTFMHDTENRILKAADAGNRSYVVIFPDGLDKEDKDRFYIDMSRLGYTLDYNYSGSSTAYSSVAVRW